jgi:hypothetical protein
MVFNRLKLWVRILNLPFGYMQKKSGTVIASSIGVEGNVPVVDCDALGKCWGNFMRVRVEIDVDKPLQRGVTVFSQRPNVTDWFEIQYENLPRYCFSCGKIGHSSIECLNPGERDAEGKLPYSADRLCAADEKKKKYQGTQSSSGSVSAGKGRSSSPAKEKANETGNTSGAVGQAQSVPQADASSTVMNGQLHPRARTNMQGKGKAHAKNAAHDGKMVSGKKRKNIQEYRPKTTTMLIAEPVNPLAMVVCDMGSDPVVGDELANDALGDDSNKKRRSVTNGSADQAGAVEQPRQTQ